MVALSAKLNRLFDVMHPRDAPPMPTEAAADGITTQTGVVMSAAYLSELRAGVGREPCVDELVAIAQFFGVSSPYLTEDRPDIEDQLTLLELMRDSPRVFECRRLG